MRIREYAATLLIVLIISCKTQLTNDSNSDPKIENFGDSLRIETERVDETTIRKNYIDLKGISDDGFDSSFEVISTFRERTFEIKIKNGYTFYVDQYKFVMERKPFLQRIQKINRLQEKNAIPHTILHYHELKSAVENGIKLDGPDVIDIDNFTADLLTYGTYSIEDKTGEVQPSSLLVEFYTTPFSGGRKFYIKTSEKDTVFVFSKHDWDK